MATDLERLLAMLAADTSGVPQEYRQPDVPQLVPSGFAREPSLRMPVSRGGRFLDNFAASIADVPPPQARRGAGFGEQFLTGLAGGTAAGFARGRLTDAAERELFNRSQAEQTAARVKERDASFKTARTKADAVRRDRITQMRSAIDRHTQAAERADAAARNAADDGSRASWTAQRDARLADVQRIETDLARLEKREPRSYGSFAPVTAKQRPPSAPKTPGATTAGTPPAAVDIADEDLYMPAVQYVVTGQMPPLGMGNAASSARLRIFKIARKLFPNANIAENAATFGANRGSLAAMQKMYDSATAFESTALKNSDILKRTLAGVGETGSPLFNRVLRSSAKTLAGDPQMAKFATALAVVQPEFARILSSPTMVGQLTDQARKEMETIVSPDATVQQILGSLDVLRQDADNRRAAYSAGLNIIRDRIRQNSTLPGTVQPNGGAFQWAPSSLSGGQ